MLYLRLPIRGKNFALIWAGNDALEGEQFIKFGFTYLSRDSHYFLQSDSPEWKMFEFWTMDQDLILAESLKIASLLGMELHGPFAHDPDFEVMYPNGL
jgi:hypothetical protein